MLFGPLLRSRPHPKTVDECSEHCSIPLVLVDVEDRVELPPVRRFGEGVPVYRHRETSFTVDESHDPARIELEHSRRRGFLLIVRTGRIFTVHVVTVIVGCDIQDEYRRILGCSSI